MTQTLLQSLLSPASGNPAAHVANALLRFGAGLMILCVHGLHKAAEAARHAPNLADWPLAQEIRAMHLPAPVAQALLATLVQIVAPLFIIAGFATRLAGALLAAILCGAIAQNLTAGRDPQLAILYTLAAITIAIWGGGRYSLDARRASQPTQAPRPGISP